MATVRFSLEGLSSFSYIVSVATCATSIIAKTHRANASAAFQPTIVEASC